MLINACIILFLFMTMFLLFCLGAVESDILLLLFIIITVYTHAGIFKTLNSFIKQSQVLFVVSFSK